MSLVCITEWAAKGLKTAESRAEKMVVCAWRQRAVTDGQSQSLQVFREDNDEPKLKRYRDSHRVELRDRVWGDGQIWIQT